MKLVYRYSWGDIVCSGTSYIAFEYESKDKFVFDVLERFKDHEWVIHEKGTQWESMQKVELFADVFVDRYDVDSIEHSVMTLDEWFEREKTDFKMPS